MDDLRLDRVVEVGHLRPIRRNSPKFAENSPRDQIVHSYALPIDLGELRRAIRREARLLEHDAMAVESARGVDVDAEAMW